MRKKIMAVIVLLLMLQVLQIFPTEIVSATGTPSVYLINPKNATTSVVRHPLCRIWANQSGGVALTVNWYNSTTGATFYHQQKNSTVTANSTVQWNYSQAKAFNTSYYWRVTVYDGTINATRLYYFRTKIPSRPTITLVFPGNGSTGIGRSPTCKITASSQSGTSLKIDWYSSWTRNASTRRQMNNSVAANSTVQWNDSWAYQTYTDYYWAVAVNDGSTNVSNCFKFTTAVAPSIYLISPKNASTNVSRQPNCRIKANDTRGRTLTVNWWEDVNSTWRRVQKNSSVASNSTVQWNFSHAHAFSTLYYWRVSIYDGVTNLSRYYSFTTKSSIPVKSWYIIQPKDGATTNRQPLVSVWVNNTVGGNITADWICFAAQMTNQSTGADQLTFNGNGSYYNAQTFTTSESSTVLSNIRLKLIGYGPSLAGRVVVQIQSTIGGLPSGVVLASNSATAISQINNATAYWYNFNFASPITLNAGTMYAVVIRTGTYGAYAGCIWNKANPYPNGQAYQWSIEEDKWVNPAGGPGDLCFSGNIESSEVGWAYAQENITSANTRIQWNFSSATQYSKQYAWALSINFSYVGGWVGLGTTIYHFTTKAGPHIPTTYLVYPKNGSSNLNKKPTIKIWGNDSEWNSTALTVNFYYWNGYWAHAQRNKTDSGSSQYTQYQWNFSQATGLGTAYAWKITLSDGTTNVSQFYWFSIKYEHTATNPTASAVYPLNQSTNISLQPLCRASINNTDGATTELIRFYSSTDGITWRWEQTNYTVKSNSTVQWNYSRATAYNTTYYWRLWVLRNSTDTNWTFWFTTKTYIVRFLLHMPCNGSTGGLNFVTSVNETDASAFALSVPNGTCLQVLKWNTTNNCWMEYIPGVSPGQSNFAISTGDGIGVEVSASITMDMHGSGTIHTTRVLVPGLNWLGRTDASIHASDITHNTSTGGGIQIIRQWNATTQKYTDYIEGATLPTSPNNFLITPGMAVAIEAVGNVTLNQYGW